MRLATHRISDLILTDHEFQLPLDPDQPNRERIAVFAREVTTPRQEHAQLPWLVFFQGGPGCGSPRPEGNTGWLRRATQDYRVLLLDQRGTTARSSAVHARSLARRGSVQAQVDYLKLFRADAIVADAEQIRRELLGEKERWSVLGQSFGGFCVTHYLAAAPEGLREAFITGGLPPLGRNIDDVYRATYRRVIQKNRLYYTRYPRDAAKVREIIDQLRNREVRTPNGGRLTPRRFLQLGLLFGMSYGFETVHYLVEEAWNEGVGGQEFGTAFLHALDHATIFDTHPIYSLLQEACYCEGTASNWSSERVFGEFPEFSLDREGPPYFTGEMIFPWMFQDYAELQPLAEVADALARQTVWPALYPVEALRRNSVPTAGLIYTEDMYVERAFSEETAQQIGGIKLWITNEYEHNGLRADGERVLGRLIGLVRGET